AVAVSGRHPGRCLSTGGLKTGSVTITGKALRRGDDVEEGFSHLPVMPREVVELLLPVPAGLIVDSTVGGAGHAALLLDEQPDIRLLGLDRAADAVDAARARLARFGTRAHVEHGGFEQLAALVAPHGEGVAVMGILMDLGVSSPQ